LKSQAEQMKKSLFPAWTLSQEKAVFVNQHHPSPDLDDCFMLFQDRDLLLRDRAFVYPVPPFSESKIITREFLGIYENRNCYAVLVQGCTAAADDAWFSMREVREILSIKNYAMASRGLQLAEWAICQKFCGRCGEINKRNGAARVCSCCGKEYFPPVAPSMIVLVHDGERILLARSPSYPKNLYSILSGFVEPGESVEQSVHREVFEEVGIKICNLEYVASQPWPFPHSLMLGYQAQYSGGEIKKDPTEIDDAHWYAIHDLPLIPSMSTIAGWMIRKRQHDLGING